MDEARRQWYGKADLTLVLGEIDDPRFHPVVGDIDPERRVAFYARHGTQVVIGPYFQPRLEGEGKKRVYNLLLAVVYGSGKRSVPKVQWRRTAHRLPPGVFRGLRRGQRLAPGRGRGGALAP